MQHADIHPGRQAHLALAKVVFLSFFFPDLSDPCMHASPRLLRNDGDKSVLSPHPIIPVSLILSAKVAEEVVIVVEVVVVVK